MRPDVRAPRWYHEPWAILFFLLLCLPLGYFLLLRSRTVGRPWENGCSGSRGIALDADRGLLFTGCAEGGATAVSVATGSRAGSIAAETGVDVIDYNATLHHLYVPGATSGAMAIVDVSVGGQLALVRSVPTAVGSHCVVSDQHHRAFVCNPSAGEIIVIED